MIKMIAVKNNFLNQRSNRRPAGGYSLIEALIYIVILVIVVTAVITLVVAMIRALDDLKIKRQINRSAQVALERIERDIRAAESVNVADSVFDSHPGALSITADDNTYIFFVSGDTLVMTENGGAEEPLLESNIEVVSLVFRQISGGQSTSIRTELILSHENNPAFQAPFYAAAARR